MKDFTNYNAAKFMQSIPVMVFVWCFMIFSFENNNHNLMVQSFSIPTTSSSTTKTTRRNIQIYNTQQQQQPQLQQNVREGKSTILWSSSSTSMTNSGIPTELPDSLEDAAELAAVACADFVEATGGNSGRCRVDFDTSAGDETYTLLKQSTEFMQYFVSKLSYRIIPGLLEERQSEMMKVATARAELQALMALSEEEQQQDDVAGKKAECIQILESGGRDIQNYKWKGPTVRVYFPDEGSAALARRDWIASGNPMEAKVPPCVQFSSCGGVQLSNAENDMLVFFFCPKASEANYVEELLQKTETTAKDLKLTVFVNPQLVDMGVTGFGMAGRRLRERLLDGLVNTYYLRTLQWGALTRVWPNAYSVWQEDTDEDSGYKLIKALPYLPSNPEVEDIYDIANGNMAERKSGGILDQFGDFVNGMMKL